MYFYEIKLASSDLEQVTDVPAVFLHVVVHLAAGNRGPFLVYKDLLDDEAHTTESSIVTCVAPLGVLIYFVNAIYQANLHSNINACKK